MDTIEKSATRRIQVKMLGRDQKESGDIRFVSYEELEDNGQDLDQPK